MDLDAVLDAHIDQARRELEYNRILREQLLTGELDVTSPDRTVKVTQNCAGEVRSIEIASGAFQKHDEASLAKLLVSMLQAGRRAGRQAAEKLTTDIMQEQER